MDDGEVPIEPPGVLEELSRAECFRLLRQVPIGRLGLSQGALPVVLPVNFVVSNGAVIFRTAPGTKLAAATAGTVVAFEADSYDKDGTSGWSVLIQGQATEATDPAEVEEPDVVGLRSWALDGRADRFVKVAATTVTGRRFRRPKL